MKQTKKEVYVLNTPKKSNHKTLEEAERVNKWLLEDGFINEPLKITKKEIIEYEIEPGDKIRLKDYDNKVIPDRIDRVVKITKNAWGDKIYVTEEINGNKKGHIYPKYAELIKGV